MCLPFGWISPEAAPKLIKLLQEANRVIGSYNHFVKAGNIYYFNGKSFHEDARYFEGKITEVKVGKKKALKALEDEKKGRIKERTK